MNSSDSPKIFRRAVVTGRKLVRYSRRKFFSRSKDSNLRFKGISPIVAVDVMGGDFAPYEIIKGCIRAAKELNIRVQMVGPENTIKQELSKYNNTDNLPLEIVHCEKFISMEEKNPASFVRKNKDSSIIVTMQQVADNKAHAAVSAGSTGAAAAAALFTLKRIAGIERPAIALRIPTAHKKDIIVLDVGGNVDPTPFQMAQHAVMGSILAKEQLNIDNPKVGLLSIGEEPSKGNKLTKETFDILQQIQSIDFFGNVEGRVLSDRECDVVVCDGFTGNVFLKTIEGSIKLIFTIIVEALTSSLNSKMGALLCKPALRQIKNNKLNPAKYGGAVLLGVGGVVIISHGNSNDFAIMNAINLAANTAKSNIIAKIQDSISEDEILKDIGAKAE